MIYDKPYPLYNFSVAFYYKLDAGKDKYVPAFDKSNMSVGKAKLPEIRIYQAGKSLFVESRQSEQVKIDIYSLSGSLLKSITDIVPADRKEYTLDRLAGGMYIAKVATCKEANMSKVLVN